LHHVEVQRRQSGLGRRSREGEDPLFFFDEDEEVVAVGLSQGHCVLYDIMFRTTKRDCGPFDEWDELDLGGGFDTLEHIPGGALVDAFMQEGDGCVNQFYPIW